MSLFTSLIGVSNKETNYYYTSSPCWGAFNSSLNAKLQTEGEKYQFVKVGIFTDGSKLCLTNNTFTPKKDIEKYLNYIGEIMECPLVKFEDYHTNYDYLCAVADSPGRLGKINRSLEKYDEMYPKNTLDGYQATFDISKPIELPSEARQLFFKHFGPLVRMSYENTFNPILNSVLSYEKTKPFLFKHFTFYELLYLEAVKRRLTGQGHSAWPNNCELPNVKKFLEKIRSKSVPSSMFNCFSTIKDVELSSVILKIVDIKEENDLLEKFLKLNTSKK